MRITTGSLPSEDFLEQTLTLAGRVLLKLGPLDP